MKLAGVVLLLLGGAAGFWEFSRTQRRQLALTRDLSAAMKQLAGEIRWRGVTVPEAMRGMRDRKISGTLFDDVYKEVESDIPLQTAWNLIMAKTPAPICEALLAMEWGGDMQRQEDTILYVARQLTDMGEEMAGTLRQREKLCAAATFSATALLALILI